MKTLICNKLILKELDFGVGPLLNLLMHRVDIDLHIPINNSFFRSLIDLCSFLIGRWLFYWWLFLIILFNWLWRFYFGLCSCSWFLLTLLSLTGLSFDSFSCNHWLCRFLDPYRADISPVCGQLSSRMASLSDLFLEVLNLTHLSYLCNLLFLLVNEFDIGVSWFGHHWL